MSYPPIFEVLFKGIAKLECRYKARKTAKRKGKLRQFGDTCIYYVIVHEYRASTHIAIHTQSKQLYAIKSR